MKKVLIVATVVKMHIMVFHIPYLEWFKKNGYEVHVCASNDYDNKEDCKIPFCDEYHDLPFERSPFKSGNIKVYKNLKDIIDINNYDIIHCHTPMGGVLTRLAARSARKNGTKIIYTAHGFHFFKGAPFLNWLAYYSIERWLALYTDVLITINKEDYARANKSFKAGRVEYIPGVGIDTKKFSEVIIDKSEKYRELGIPEDAFVLLSVGELNKNKNHETVIRALAKLNNSGIHYLICGQGLLENYLRDLIKELALESQVHLLGFRKDISEICKASDLFVFPSFREGLSVALMEAMATGLPVVCSCIRGNNDLIQDGNGGYLVKPDDIEGFANAIEKLYEGGDLRKRHETKVLKLVQKYSLENVLKEMELVYASILD